MNFLSQVRALPNPAAGSVHPLTLHLTATATANILVTALTPAAASSQPFVKISPDAEVVVAPKTRQASRPASSRDNRSIASTSRKSTTGKSRSGHDEDRARPPLFLRGLSRALKNEWLDDESEDMKDEGLKVWVDREHLLDKTLRGIAWVAVSLVQPAGLQEHVDPQSLPSAEQTPSSKVVAKLSCWEDAPDSRHTALSSLLCAALGSPDMVGGVICIEPAPPSLPKTASALKDSSQQTNKDAIVKRLRITPFGQDQTAPGFKFGGESKAENHDAWSIFKSMFGKGLIEGPLTNGMLLPKQGVWPGGLLDFDPAPSGDPSKARTQWLLGGERRLDVSVQPMIPQPALPRMPGESLPSVAPSMVGIETIISGIRASLLDESSVLLTGGLGSGKTSLTQLLAHELRNEKLFSTTYFPCRNLVSDETRIKTIKDTLYRVFTCAAWNARLGGRALVILDDLDKLCPVETELQVDSNGRSRQVSEVLSNMIRQFCGRDSSVVLLATAQSKEALHNVVISGHVVRDIVALKAPNKDGRRQVLNMIVRETCKSLAIERNEGAAANESAASDWMEGSDDGDSPVAEEKERFAMDPDLDLLHIAGQTDGYMPGDLKLLVSRARSEALIRTVSDLSESDHLVLNANDFAAALNGFTPASLRGVTLHSSTTTFAAIGGLKETRKVLLETLQYPTTYAPLFAKCPLRLRSGLLLYGYPGCGKTLLASAVAGECGLNFISVKGPEILNKYIGASEKSVRDLFDRAEAAKPCILFFDEFDSIAPKRGHDSTGVTDRVVNMLLTMMDGAEGLSGVYVLAATSRPDLIDPALLRPGRLDKSLICDMPSEEDRLDILQAIGAKLNVDPNMPVNGSQSFAEVARRTEGYSGADLQAVIYNAHLEAIHDILGSVEGDAQDFGKRKPGSAGRSNKHQDFAYFRLGGDDQATNGAQTLAGVAAERAQIAAKLSAMQLSRRKAKQDRQAQQQQQHQHQRPGSAAGRKQPNGVIAETKASKEPVISWRHLQKSLESSRSSISAQERRRLARIYREFVVGRNGEMSDGQGSSEVGGRTSLM